MNAHSNPSSSDLPSTAKNDRVYAIGDIHGRHDLLKSLLALIDDHSAAMNEKGSHHIIVLGDMIDRGPDSRAVIRTLRELGRKSEITVLLGNHEEMMLRAIDGEPGVMKAWLRFGGDATLRSFGIEPPQGDFDQPALIRAIKDAIPERWLEWLRGLPVSARSGDYFFCHAGIRPGVDLKRQDRSDLIWIRDDFLSSDEAHGVVVVHGHSITPDVELRHNRIGIDTGAYRTDMLTAAYFAGRLCHILSTGDMLESGPAQSPDQDAAPSADRQKRSRHPQTVTG